LQKASIAGYRSYVSALLAVHRGNAGSKSRVQFANILWPSQCLRNEYGRKD